MKFSTIIVATAVSFFSTAALAAEDAGTAMAVIDTASAEGRVGDRPLSAGSNVFIGDLVTTDTIGEAQLLFLDGTRMVVGSNSSLVIDEFVFRGKAAENTFSVRALGGAFRFISGFVNGDGDDSGYLIQTPSSAIGVRGTAFDFTVTPGEGTKLVLLDGEVTLCGVGGDCATIVTRCALLNADTGRQIEKIEIIDGREQETRKHFPYLTRQSSLLEQFRVDHHGCTAGTASADPRNSGHASSGDSVDGAIGNAAGTGFRGGAGQGYGDSGGDSDDGSGDGGENDSGDDDGGDDDGGDNDGGESQGGDSNDTE